MSARARTGLEWRILRRLPLPELALAAIALLLSGLGAEAYLRRFHPIGATIYTLHPRYLLALLPGARKLFVHRPENGGGRVLVEVNGDGFLGPELKREPGTRRVVVYGDSFVAGEFSPLAERFSSRLAAALSEGLGARFEAVNAGVVAYGPDQVALRLEDEIGPLAPDLVVVAVFAGNDFGDLLRNRLFRLTPEELLEQRQPGIAPALRREFERAERRARGSMLLRGLRELWASEGSGPPAARRDSLLPVGGFPLLLEKRQREYREAVLEGESEVRQLLGDPYDADLSLRPGSESARYKTALMEKVLLRIAATARQHQVPIVFVFIPSAFDVCDSWERPDQRSFPDYRPDALTRALALIATRNSLDYLDLYPSFRATSADSLYFRLDEHWNARGQALAAGLTQGVIVSRRLLSAPTR